MTWRVLVCVVVLGAGALARPDWTVRRDPFDPAVVARYKQMLVRDPHADAPLARLVASYRASRTVAALEAEYAHAPAEWANLVVLARLHRSRGDAAGALGLFERAVVADPDHAATWLAVAQLRRAAGAFEAARAAYDRALGAAPTRSIAVDALHAAIDLSVADGDRVSADGYYVELLELEPRNASLWTERADSAAAAGAIELALDSYEAAETLLAGDPVRRLDVLARRGSVLETIGDNGRAIAAYERAIDLAPRGYYLVRELTDRIIAIYRKAHALARLATGLAYQWPSRTRGYFEWSTLGRIYDELGRRRRAIEAFEHAMRAAPQELETARRLIHLLDLAGRTTDALAQLEVAAAAAPGEATIQLELADRYRHVAPVKAIATLMRLAAVTRDVSALTTIAQRATEWGHFELARESYERIVHIEPDDADHWIDLARAYLVSQDPAGARAAWKRVAKPRADAAARFAQLLVDDDAFADALAVLDEAIAHDPTSAALFATRAWAYVMLGHGMSALADAERSRALTAPDSAARRTARHELVEILNRTHDFRWRGDPDDVQAWSAYRSRWFQALVATPPDIEAGYLLVELWSIAPCFSLSSDCELFRQTLETLFALAPDDPAVVAELVRVYRTAEMYDDALARLHDLARLEPAHAASIARQLAEVDHDRRAAAYSHEHVPDPLPDASRREAPRPTADPLAEPVRIGARLGVGTTLRGDADTSLSVGAVAIIQIATLFDLVSRADWSEHEQAASAFGASSGLSRRVVATPGIVLAVGAAARGELRSSDRMADRAGLAADLTLDLTARRTPFGTGLRIEQWLLGGARNTSAVLELTVELR